MDNVQITQGDGEPPIYREMKPVPLSLESCILNSEEDFPYSQTQPVLVTKENCDGGELSAEEITSMIMINEGPNALSSAQEELQSNKVSPSIKNNSDIKKILTNDLPRSGRFLSTKSLQKLSGAKKVIKKNLKYMNEDESDTDNPPRVKQKSVLLKKIRTNQGSLNKTSKPKLLVSQIDRKKVKVDKIKMKSFKKGNSLDKLKNRKKLKTLKKLEIIKPKDMTSSAKILKKKESNLKESKIDAEFNSEKKPKLMISRSGRIRKIKDVSDFVVTKKEGKILNPDNVVMKSPASNKIETSVKFSVNNVSEVNSEPVKENKVQKDLLQSALSESVESWFENNSEIENKGKKTRRRSKIIPKDSDICFEEPPLMSKNVNDSASQSPVDDCNSKLNCVNSKPNHSEKITNNDNEESRNSQDSNSVGSASVENTKINAANSDIKEIKRTSVVSGKKAKPPGRKVLGYKKKRRNVNVTSYLKNYGEKINFDIKLDSELEKSTLPANPFKSETNAPKSSKKYGEQENINLKSRSKRKSVGSETEKYSSFKNNPMKRSLSTESLPLSTETKFKSPQKSAEMPASLPSREKDLKSSFVVLHKATTKNKKSEKIKEVEKLDKEPKAMKTKKNDLMENKGNKIEKVDLSKLSKIEKNPQTSSLKNKNLEYKKNKNILKMKRRSTKEVKKQLLALARKEKIKKRLAKMAQTNPNEEKITPNSKLVNGTNKTGDLEINKNDKIPEVSDEKSQTIELLSAHSELSIPLKKRQRRIKSMDMQNSNETLNENNVSENCDRERRKSHREIKLTPKIVDMIGKKRSRKSSCSKDESSGVETENSNGRKGGKELESKSVKKDSTSLQTFAATPSVENYLQTKMEENASNFESSWEPGDLVWARFAGNPFWPAVILRDPFTNDEYSRVKYLGRLPRPFVHVQFLADFGRRAWGPELYIMSFNGLPEFEKLKANLPEVNAFTQRKDLIYQQAFFTPQKLEKGWKEAIKEAGILINKSKDERITYMKIKYPLVKYAASVANGRLVPNERTKGDTKSPPSKPKKRKSLNKSILSDDWHNKENNDTIKDSFECVNTSDLDEGTKKNNKDSPKITLKLVRSPKKSNKRRSSNAVDELEVKKSKKKIKKDVLEEEDYVPSDNGSNGDKGSESVTSKQKKYYLFKGAKTEKVCQICFEILENEKTVKCKGACQGLFHKSCADKMSDCSSPDKGQKNKKKKPKKLFAENDDSTQSKNSTEKEWRCNDCSNNENPCFVCNSKSGNRQRCCVAHCGKFYHHKCLKLYPQTVYNQGAPIKKLQSMQQIKATGSESPHYQILSCPLHVCHTCASDNPADFNKKFVFEKLVKCIKCPSAYHGGNFCVPAGSTILNTSQIICAKHGDPENKSHVNISWCFICNMGGSLICCEWCPSSFHLDCLNIKPPDGAYTCEECESGRFPLYGEVVWVKLGKYRWWPAKILFPQEIPANIMALPHKPWEFAVRFYGSNDHYWLNRGRVFLYQEGDSEQKFKGQSHVDKIYQRAVQEATKDYFAIQEERKSRLLGTNSSGMKPPPYVKIKSNKAVGKVQLGNLSQTEPQTCDCDPSSEDPCSSGSNCLNRMLLVECNPNYCKAGTRCKNQSFEKREYPPLEPYRTETRGWGLRSSIDIAEGSFVVEYVGEVVDDEEFKRRMKRKQEIKDSNYYFLTLDKDRMIDAGPKGNLARFMNHSCAPNCETQKWTVNGDTRVGLFALRNIPAGTELTFNYNLDCIGNEKKPCHCEEESCSGFIGVKKKTDKVEAVKIKAVKRQEKESEDECFVCNDGGELMVCDVPNCPKVYHLECVNLTEWPNECWFCPRHQCCICSRTTKRSCKLCPAAFCYSHLDNNLFPDSQGGILCSKHSSCNMKPAQTLRKASYVNRNSPVIEYEKPFAEKYKPPPQKEKNSPENKKEEILMEPNLTDNTPIVVENPLLTSGTNEMADPVSVQVLYVDEAGQIVGVDNSAESNTGEVVTNITEKEVPKPVKKKKRTNIPRKKLNPPVNEEESENKGKSESGGINFESLMIKSVEDKILDSKLNMDNIFNIIGGGAENNTGHTETDGAERCIKEENEDLKTESVIKKEDAEVDRSRRSKYFKIITPEKFIKVSESESNQKKVTDFNYIEFMHPLRSARSKTKTDENTRK